MGFQSDQQSETSPVRPHRERTSPPYTGSSLNRTIPMAGENEFTQNICIPGVDRLTPAALPGNSLAVFSAVVYAWAYDSAVCLLGTDLRDTVRKEKGHFSLWAASLSSIKNSVGPGNFHGCPGSVWEAARGSMRKGTEGEGTLGLRICWNIM